MLGNQSPYNKLPHNHCVLDWQQMHQSRKVKDSFFATNHQSTKLFTGKKFSPDALRASKLFFRRWSSVSRNFFIFWPRKEKLVFLQGGNLKKKNLHLNF